MAGFVRIVEAGLQTRLRKSAGLEPPTNTKYENNARAKSTGDRVIELLLSEAFGARKRAQAESKGSAFNMRV